jgi:uncharacterized protein (TIGR02145 family)
MIGVGLGVVAKRRYSGFPFALRSFWQRVRDTANSTMFDYNSVLALYRGIQNAGLDTDGIKLAWNSDGAAVVRTDGILKFYREGFGIGLDLDGSATATAQPRQVSGIAPGSKIAAGVQHSGDVRKFTHTAVEVTGTYTLVKCLNDETVGKTAVTYTEVGASTLTEVTWTGNLYAYIIYAGVITAGQRTALSAFLLAKYPEIESVVIGTQEWSLRNFEATRTALGVDIPNVTVNADWANATVLYNAAISGGATEREALIASAMWCYYDNDAANGAIYGKLYNWYAAKLLDLDIVAYNAANPSAPWGWRVPTSAQFTTLATYLGGTSVAGGKMKMTGLDYWNTPNTGATNESGFTGLGGGRRNNTGAFSLLKVFTYFTETTSGFFQNRLTNTSEAFSRTGDLNLTGGISIRLIKE